MLGADVVESADDELLVSLGEVRYRVTVERA
jgi:hypothetical protein